MRACSIEWPGKIGSRKAKMEEITCRFSVVVFALFLPTGGQLFKHSEAVTPKLLPVVINTWPFTNATAEGRVPYKFLV